MTGPADKPFTLAFDNEDPGIAHNVEIKDARGASSFRASLQRRQDQGLRRPGAAGRHVHVRVHDPSDDDGHRHRSSRVEVRPRHVVRSFSRSPSRSSRPSVVVLVVGRPRRVRRRTVGEPAPPIVGHDARRRGLRPRLASWPSGRSSTSGARRACRAATSSRCSCAKLGSTRADGLAVVGVLMDDPPDRPASSSPSTARRGRPWSTGQVDQDGLPRRRTAADLLRRRGRA